MRSILLFACVAGWLIGTADTLSGQPVVHPKWGDDGPGNWSESPRWLDDEGNPLGNLFPNNTPDHRFVVTIESGTVDLDDQDITVNKLIMGGGSVRGVKNLFLEMGIDWRGGVVGLMQGASELVIQPEATGFFQGSGSKILDDGHIRNFGSITYSGNGFQSGPNGGTFDNHGLFLIDGDGGISRSPENPFHFRNTGTFAKVGGGGTSDLDVLFTNSGIVKVGTGELRFSGEFNQTGGSTFLAGGVLGFPGAADFQDGELAGIGSVAGSLNSAAMMRPGIGLAGTLGELVVTGNLTLNNGSLVFFHLSGPESDSFNHNVLRIGGELTLAGGLRVTILGGLAAAFQITPEDVFQLAEAGSRTGMFAGLQHGDRLNAFGPDDALMGSFELHYLSDGFAVTNFEAIPEPSTVILVLLGVGMIFVFYRRRLW